MSQGNVQIQNAPVSTSIPISPPKRKLSLFVQVKESLFSSIGSTVLTVLVATMVVFIATRVTQWAFTEAEWNVIKDNYKLLFSGQYPVEHVPRIWSFVAILALLTGVSFTLFRSIVRPIFITFALLFAGSLALPFLTVASKLWLIASLVLLSVGMIVGRYLEKIRRYMLFAWLALPLIALFTLSGFSPDGVLSMKVLSGFLLTVLLASISLIFSFPLGVLLALGRRSDMPIIKWMSIAYIELVRGIPLITVLFVAQLMLPLFLGDGIEIENVLRALIGFTLFNAAYLAENIRGGLQAIPRGQFEAAQALGLSRFSMTRYIILPQAIRTVIPALVGQVISTFKDTSLVAIVGLIDLLGMGKKIIANPNYLGTQMEVFLFIATLYFIFCFMLSKVSAVFEREYGLGKR